MPPPSCSDLIFQGLLLVGSFDVFDDRDLVVRVYFDEDDADPVAGDGPAREAVANFAQDFDTALFS